MEASMSKRKALLVFIPFVLSASALFALLWQFSLVPPIPKSEFRMSVTQFGLVPVFLFMAPVVGLFYEWLWKRSNTPQPREPLQWPIPPEVLLWGMPGMPQMPGIPGLSDLPVRQEDGASRDPGADQVEIVVLQIVEIEVIPLPLLPRRRKRWRRVPDLVVNVLVALMLSIYLVLLVLGLFDPASTRDHILAGQYLVFQLVLGAITLAIWHRRRSNRNQTPPAVREGS